MSEIKGIYAASLSVLKKDLSLDIDNTIFHAENVIDLGCLPNVKFGHLGEVVKELKNLDFYVSVDSHNDKELIEGGKAGADYLLSIKSDNFHILDKVDDSYPILIPMNGELDELYKVIDKCIEQERVFIADPVLDPIHFGFTKSIVRYVNYDGFYHFNWNSC